MELRTLLFTSEAGWSEPLPTYLDSEQTLVVAFGSPHLLESPHALSEVARGFPLARVVGCSTAGEIFHSRVLDGSLSLAIARFDSTALKSARTNIDTAADSNAAGMRLAGALSSPGLRAILVFSDGIGVNGSELVRGLAAKVDRSVIITGGLAGDGDRFRTTWVLSGDEVRTGMVTAVGFYGESVQVRYGSKGGWDIFGPERMVTRSEGSILYELDRRPALQLYKEYLGDRAAGLPATALLFPLALRATRRDSKQVVRTVLGVDEATQSMTFAGDIPLGARAQLMKANFERLIQGASDAAKLCVDVRAPGAINSAAPALAIAISCVGRRLVLGQRAEEEIEATLEGLSLGTQQIGFYSYGEISPNGNGSCELHNQTMTLTTIGEV